MKKFSCEPAVCISCGIVINIDGQKFRIEPNTPAVQIALEKARIDSSGRGKKAEYIAELSVLIGPAGVVNLISALETDSEEALKIVRDSIICGFEQLRW